MGQQKAGNRRIGRQGRQGVVQRAGQTGDAQGLFAVGTRFGKAKAKAGLKLFFRDIPEPRGVFGQGEIDVQRPGIARPAGSGSARPTVIDPSMAKLPASSAVM